MNTFITEFKEKVLSGAPSFEIKEANGRTTFCVTSAVGNVRLVYSDYSYSDYSPIIKAKLELVAVVANSKIYMLNPSHLGLFSGDFYDDVVVSYYASITDFNRQMREKHLTPFYEALKPNKLSEDEVASLKRTGRAKLMNFNYSEREPVMFFDEETFLQYLSGAINADDFVCKKLNDDIETWKEIKAIDIKLDELISNGSCAEEWELAMIKGINSVKANSLVVTFDYNGIIGSGKVAPHYLVRMIHDRDYFCDFNFCNTKDGKKLLNDLGVDNNDLSKRLKCNHIIRITYGKKVLFER